MEARGGRAAYPLDDHDAPVAAPATLDDKAWSPASDAKSPVLQLQRQLYESLVADPSLPQAPLPPLEQGIRFASRAAGYVALVGAIALIGWVIL
jgi:hypothetical protein